jgi:hypothetical protein
VLFALRLGVIPPRSSRAARWGKSSGGAASPCLFEDGSEAAVDRLDALLGGGSKDSDNVLQLDTRKLR